MKPPSEHEPYSAELTGGIDEALEGEPHAAELRHMRDLLRQRVALLRGELGDETDPKKRAKLERDLGRLHEQIAALSEEAEISQFIEDSVRVGVEMRKLQEG